MIWHIHIMITILIVSSLFISRLGDTSSSIDCQLWLTRLSHLRTIPFRDFGYPKSAVEWKESLQDAKKEVNSLFEEAYRSTRGYRGIALERMNRRIDALINDPDHHRFHAKRILETLFLNHRIRTMSSIPLDPLPYVFLPTTTGSRFGLKVYLPEEQDLRLLIDLRLQPSPMGWKPTLIDHLLVNRHGAESVDAATSNDHNPPEGDQP